MTTPPWISLHTHSEYSVLEGTMPIESIVSQAKGLGMKALALTDQGNLYGAVEFYKACQGEGIKPIIGCELFLAPHSRFEKKRIPGVPAGFPLLLFAKNEKGYQNLCKLSSLAHLEGFYYTPRIDKELLEIYHEGLICLSGPLQGKFAYLILQGRESELISEVEWFHALFKDDFYFEVQRHPMKEEDIRKDGMDKELWLYQNYLDFVRNEEVVLQKLRELGAKQGIKCVATNDAHYLAREDFRAHEILMNIQSGEPCEIWERDSLGNPKARVLNPKREVYYSHEFYFKSAEEMHELFIDMPEVLHEAAAIADKITWKLDLKTRHYPVFTPPDGFTKEEYLKRLCEEGIEKRYTQERLAKVAEKYPGKDPLAVVRERLDYELDIIISKGMCDYLLIVHDFIAWAKGQGIPMGPGRGSGAGSIILFLIAITDIEPLRFSLFFERFINPERLSYPDIDVDICMERRSEVIDYTINKYGKDKVAQIITFGTMKAKMAIKDVGRVLSIPLSRVNQIAKLIPEELGITLDKALEVDADLRREYENDPEIKELFDIARRLEGLVRSTGIHAAGIIISGDPLIERIPVCLVKDSDALATQFSMKPVEAVGMLKIDFLGLKTLTSIQKTVDAIYEYRGEKVDWVNLPLEDEATFSLFNHGKMLGIFQMESGGMQDLARQLHIDKFEEVIAVVALYRPGPMEMIPSFISRKHGKEPIEIDHPKMKDVLDETYGIMVYQEQVMQIASLLAGYSLGEGDVLRRAMGKKDHEEMAKQREKFREGALKIGIPETLSMRIFDKVEKFASYGFNKSHAAAYGYLAYVTAYLKSHYPKEWMAALLTCDRGDIAKVAHIISECQAMEIPILPPDINESGAEFVATIKGIRFAMGAIKGVGEGVVEAIVCERKKQGPFKTLFDFCRRVDAKKVGKKAIEVLIEAGCFDCTGKPRNALLLALPDLQKEAANRQREAALGIIDFISAMDETGEEHEENIAKLAREAPPLSKEHLLRREKELLGFYLTGHPLDDYRAVLQRLSCVPLDKAAELKHDAVFRAAFIVESVAIKISAKTQKKFAILEISDGLKRLDLPIWADKYEEKAPLFIENQLLYAVLQVDLREGDLKLQCRWIDDLTRVDERMIVACDAAFDLAKNQAPRREWSSDRPKQNKKPEETKVVSREMRLKIDIAELTLSQLLSLKKALRAHRGPSSVQIEFWDGGGRTAVVSVGGEWGVSPSAELEKLLRAELRSLVALE